MLINKYNRFINFFSFSPDIRKLRLKINKRIDTPEHIESLPGSHPKGFIKEFRKRRTTITEAYLLVNQSLDTDNYNERLQALALLADHIFFSRAISMPINTARVQLALIKAVVKHRYDKRIQLELMRDFTITSFGHPRTIRKYLKRLDLIEVKEFNDELRENKAAWDFHVHDNASYGRKSPTLLIIDAFIKGISELTVIHNNLDKEDAVKEVLEAGRIMGIKINIALEFSALTNNLRFHYLYILPEFSSKKKRFKKYLKQTSDDFKVFMHELDENQKRRYKNIEILVNEFNTNHLPLLNHNYPHNSVYYFQPLIISQNNTIWSKIHSRRQLGEVLYPLFKIIFEKRALLITTQYQKINKNPELYTPDQINEIKIKYHSQREQFKHLNAEVIQQKYFSDTPDVKQETAVSSLEEIFLLALKNNAFIKFIQPMEHGLQAAIDLILENYNYLSHTEVYNILDSEFAKDFEFDIFANFIKFLNSGNKHGIIILFKQYQIHYNEDKIDFALKHFNDKHIFPSIGSDSSGRPVSLPGMGFIFENQLAKWQRRYFAKTHHTLSPTISKLIYEQSRIAYNFPLKNREKPQIICISTPDDKHINYLGDENIIKPIPLYKIWEYFNPGIKNLVLITIGFTPAYYTVGAEYAVLWFAITGTRNIIVDLISGNGLNPLKWNNSDINWTNVANSLFWTGFSVPILGFIKSRFDLIWTWTHAGFAYEFAKFFFINIANGTYLATHNYIRGFDKQTIRANFFRSIIAWPFSVIFSPIGNTFALPSIVQAKFWSDFVASIIEGRGKYQNIIKLKNRIMTNILPDLLSDDETVVNLAVLDLIYFTRESNRAKTVLKKHFTNGKLNTVQIFFSLHKIENEHTQYYYALLKVFENPNHFINLSNFIITNYKKEQALYLLQLIAQNYQNFFKWLKGIHITRR